MTSLLIKFEALIKPLFYFITSHFQTGWKTKFNLERCSVDRISHFLNFTNFGKFKHLQAQVLQLGATGNPRISKVPIDGMLTRFLGLTKLAENLWYGKLSTPDFVVKRWAFVRCRRENLRHAQSRTKHLHLDLISRREKPIIRSWQAKKSWMTIALLPFGRVYSRFGDQGVYEIRIMWDFTEGSKKKALNHFRAFVIINFRLSSLAIALCGRIAMEVLIPHQVGSSLLMIYWLSWLNHSNYAYDLVFIFSKVLANFCKS